MTKKHKQGDVPHAFVGWRQIGGEFDGEFTFTGPHSIRKAISEKKRINSHNFTRISPAEVYMSGSPEFEEATERMKMVPVYKLGEITPDDPEDTPSTH